MNVRNVLFDATPQDWPRIENMMQFYNYDLSEWCPVRLSDEGRYAIAPKGAYWSSPSVRPYLVRVDGELAGFTVVDGETTQQTSQFNLGYFFVARRFRGTGLAHKMAQEIFERHRGNWEIYFFESNVPASRFWPKAILLAAQPAPQFSSISIDNLPSLLYTFST